MLILLQALIFLRIFFSWAGHSYLSRSNESNYLVLLSASFPRYYGPSFDIISGILSRILLLLAPIIGCNLLPNMLVKCSQNARRMVTKCSSNMADLVSLAIICLFYLASEGNILQILWYPLSPLRVPFSLHLS